MKTIKKYYKLKANVEDIYNALTNPTMIEIWTGEKATMSTEPNSEFSLWGDSITGKNIEFIENQKIVQEWYFGENQKEPSIVTIKLHPDKNYTSVELKHTNIPDDAFENICEGWDMDYFDALKELFI